MKTRFKILISILLIFGACTQENPVFPDFDYTAVYFPLQYPIRTLSLGDDEIDNSMDKELRFNIGVAIGGMYENNEEWTVDYVVDESLAAGLNNLDGDTIIALPSNYYSITPVGQLTIPSGSFSGLLDVQLTDAFLDDALAFTGQYVIPLKITDSSADSVLQGEENYPDPDPRVLSDWITPPKDFVLFGIKFINEYHGDYLQRGVDISYDSLDVPFDTVIYNEIFVVDDKVVKVATKGRNTVFTNFMGYNSGLLDGEIQMELSFDASNQITIDSISGTTFQASGTGQYALDAEIWGDQSRDVMYLQYEYTDGTNRHEVVDTLVFRNRGIHFEDFTPVVVDAK